MCVRFYCRLRAMATRASLLVRVRRACRAEPYNATYFDEYVANATAPALPEVLELYEKLLSLGIKVVFITGRHDDEEAATVKNLRSAGYHTWEKLVLKYVNV